MKLNLVKLANEKGKDGREIKYITMAFSVPVVVICSVLAGLIAENVIGGVAAFVIFSAWVYMLTYSKINE